MTRLTAFVRNNAIGLIALFIALGGTSYAAIAIPAASVGTKQLRDGSITPAKLDSGEIGGTVRAWARVNADGTIVTSSGFSRTVRNQEMPGVTAVVLKNSHLKGCAASASVVPPTVGAAQPGSALATLNTVARPYGVAVETYDAAGQPTPLPYVVQVLC
jgi:hypothetical protein